MPLFGGLGEKLRGKSLFLLFNIAVFGSREIEKPLFEQGFFQGVNAWGAQYILQPCFVRTTRKVKRVLWIAAFYTVIFMVGNTFVYSMI